MARQVRSVSKPLTPEERERHRQIRAEVERDKPALMALGTSDQRGARAIAALKSKREELGLSLVEVGERTEILITLAQSAGAEEVKTQQSKGKRPQ